MDQGEHILLNDDLEAPYRCSCGSTLNTENLWYEHIGERIDVPEFVLTNPEDLKPGSQALVVLPSGWRIGKVKKQGDAVYVLHGGVMVWLTYPLDPSQVISGTKAYRILA